MTDPTRRGFVHLLIAGGCALSMQSLVARSRLGESALLAPAVDADGGYGPLVPTLTSNSAERLLELPEGFQYVVIGKTGTHLDDGFITPGRHDGMAAFDAAGRIRLVRNHEVGGVVNTPMGDARTAYDLVAGGGTVTMEIDPVTRMISRQFVSLSGTSTNCGGGSTPWGSWISCEETTVGEAGGYRRPHGYCFEVPSAASGQITPIPLRAMGRFVHEALCVDPKTGIVYLTEDGRGGSGLYRFLPERPGELSAGGVLQMLAVTGQRNYDARTNQDTARTLPVTWVNIPQPDPSEAETNSQAVFQQGWEAGGAIFSRLEGIFHEGNSVFFISTNGGDNALGQVWEYRIRSGGRRRPASRGSRDGSGALRLVFESPAEAVLDRPDNICISPRGSLVICEDGFGDQFVRGLARDGRIFDFARNIVPGFEGAEFAGATFSPDGQTLFLNIQNPGMTLAIWGPWDRGVF